MRVLVAGGAGYIGSHTCKALAEAGHVPVVYDNLHTGHRWAVKWGAFEQGDINDPAALGAAMKRHKPEAVINFAALAYVGESTREPTLYYRVNVGGMLTLVETMRARYDSPEAASRMRDTAARYALETFGLTEEQLVCMAYSPFAEKASGLGEFLGREHPALAGRAADIRALLADHALDDPPLAAELLRISGLELSRLRVLHGRSVRRPDGGAGTDAGTEVIGAVLAGDPHKAVIRTRLAPGGPHTLEQISGR